MPEWLVSDVQLLSGNSKWGLQSVKVVSIASADGSTTSALLLYGLQIDRTQGHASAIGETCVLL
jgi:hypothetical protein